MAEPRKDNNRTTPSPATGRDRETAADRSGKGTHYQAGADGEQDIDASAAEADEANEPEDPDEDGSGW